MSRNRNARVALIDHTLSKPWRDPALGYGNVELTGDDGRQHIDAADDDNSAVQTEEECYDIAWFDDDGYIELKSLAVVVLCAAFALNQREFDSVVGFYAKGQGLAHDIIWKRFCDIDHEITGRDYRRQTRRMYHLLAPYVRDILEEVQEHHERIMRAKAIEDEQRQASVRQ